MTYDALVIGAGAGGMAAAARLQHLGHRTLLVDRRDRVGGRASSMEVEGPDGTTFTVNTGALIFETGGENGRLFDDVGADPGVIVPERPVVLRLGGRDIPLMSGPTGKVFVGLVGGFGALARRLPRLRPERGISVEQWSGRLGRRASDLIRSLCSAFFGAGPADVEAALFFDYFTRPMAVFGAHPEGSVGPWRALAEHYQRAGGELWLDADVESITVGDSGNGRGLATGAVIRRGGETVTVDARVIVSNAGPLATVGFCGDAAFPDGYADEVRAWSKPGSLITVNFASRVPMSRMDGLMFFGSTRRLAYGGNITALSPKMVPDGWHLYACAGTPLPATGDFDLAAEVGLIKADLRATFPEFASAIVLSVEVCAGPDWPAQRAIAGKGQPRSTPIGNLWNVGDGVYEWAAGGQSGCVESARLVVEEIQRRYPAGTLRT